MTLTNNDPLVAGSLSRSDALSRSSSEEDPPSCIAMTRENSKMKFLAHFDEVNEAVLRTVEHNIDFGHSVSMEVCNNIIHRVILGSL